jgi:hypothetical protein
MAEDFDLTPKRNIRCLRNCGFMERKQHKKILLISTRFIFTGNTPQLAAAGIKGIRIQPRDGSVSLVLFSCGCASHAPPACSGVRRRRLTTLKNLVKKATRINKDIPAYWP